MKLDTASAAADDDECESPSWARHASHTEVISTRANTPPKMAAGAGDGEAELRAEVARLRTLVRKLGGDPDAGAAAPSEPTVPQDQQVKRAPVVVKADNLRSMVAQIVAAAGSSEAEADLVASNLVLSNLKGHDSHGVGYLPRYIKGALSGLIKQDAVAAVIADTPTMVLLDGGIGFGQSLGGQAMALGIPKANSD